MPKKSQIVQLGAVGAGGAIATIVVAPAVADVGGAGGGGALGGRVAQPIAQPHETIRIPIRRYPKTSIYRLRHP